MGNGILNTNQVINGVAILLSFFIGYKYALKRQGLKEKASRARVEPEDVASAVLSKRGYKMVLVVRNDLKMGRGKIAAQCGHGAVGAYQTSMERNARIVRAWENTGCAKIALKVESEAEMMAIKRVADTNNLCTCLIRDAGHTQIAPNSKTVLAIGPAAVEVIDKITGHLKLL